MEIGWESRLYNVANECIETSWEKWEEQKIGESWGYTFSARLAHLANAVVNVVILPFAAIGVIFALLHSLFTCSGTMIKPQWKYFIQRSDHFYLSLIGSVLSPAAINWYQKQQDAPDAKKWLNINITYVVGTIRGALYLGGAFYYFS